MKQDSHWDDIIVGAGTAGSVLAARLSSDPGRRVLLLEAGPDYDAANVPAPLLDARAAVTKGFNWELQASVQDGGLFKHWLDAAGVLAAAGARDFFSAARASASKAAASATPLQQQPYFPGKVVGGTSAVNGAVALRGHARDFDAWSAVAGEDWTWAQVQERYARIEDDRDFARDGAAGVLPVVRATDEELHPAQAAFMASCRKQGLPFVPNLNHDPRPGVGLVPNNRVGQRRISAAAAYLDPVRNRPNLRVMPGSHVSRVVFDGTRAVGIEVAAREQRILLRSERVTLCAGSLNTPPILMRSGVADARLCERLGVECVVNLPGVGENLVEHPTVMLWMVPKPGICGEGEPHHQAMARLVTPDAGTSADLFLFMLSGLLTTELPMLSDLLRSRWACAVSVMLSRPESRGRVFVANSDPTTKPEIHLNLGTDTSDVDRLVAGVRVAWQVIRQSPLAELMQSTFMWNDNIVHDDRLARRAVARFINGAWHAFGTARMGRDDDPGAVVDSRFRVLGTRGLRVVDASVIPALSVPPSLTCMLLGERAADWMHGDSP